MLADYHVHTAFSDDSDYAMEQVVEDAFPLGWMKYHAALPIES